MSFATGIGLFIAWAAAVAISDCRARRISNSIVVAGLAAAFGCALFGCGPFGISLLQAGIGALVGLFSLLPFFAFGLMGAADVKVFAVLGAWCGMHALLGLWMAASLAAGIHALWLLIVTRTRLAGLGQNGRATFELAGKASTPYAACLSVAATLWLVLRATGRGL
ncbi:prepilin peptidase [Paraburkholderia sp. Cy-641]|uniref:A24 family peptidase n=1 Tax=Paraburkholderia sp. Cy-641 TaxID=2608337 RepID=UPI0014230D87|nr:prepilin peptidase [Paraburkholderia sp. Cy-641]NIF80329.1 prepilin peptidase [Paraburkholderia sp. Cy-641]